MKTESTKENPINLAEVVPSNTAGGWAAITHAPGKKTLGSGGVSWDRDLGADLDRLKKLGCTTLIPLITDEELLRLQIPHLVEEARERSLEVRRFPILDEGIPSTMAETLEFVGALVDWITRGQRVVLHCNGGLGRSGTMAACLRLALALDRSPGEAIKEVRKARSPLAIETREQEKFIGEFHCAWEKRSTR